MADVERYTHTPLMTYTPPDQAGWQQARPISTGPLVPYYQLPPVAPQVADSPQQRDRVALAVIAGAVVIICVLIALVMMWFIADAHKPTIVPPPTVINERPPPAPVIIPPQRVEMPHCFISCGNGRG